MATDIPNTAVLLLSCKDRIGLVSRIAHFIFERGGNIVDLAEHVEPEEKIFSIRVEWDMHRFSIPAEEIAEAFTPMAKEFNAVWRIEFPQRKSRLALFVSRYDHCLQDLLWRYSVGEYHAEIPLVISNHSDLKSLVEGYGIVYHRIPITPESKKRQEKKELDLLKAHRIDSIVLARYMQILTPEFVSHYPNQIINIHHSFLPAFIGGNPYRQAFDRGVKIIGATSHYVTDDLDEGPILEQDIIRVTHRDTVSDLKRKGRDLERIVLARALHYHLDHRVLVRGKKTIIFQ